METLIVEIKPATIGVKEFQCPEESVLVAIFTNFRLSTVGTKARNKPFLKKIFFHKCKHLSGGLNGKNRACSF